MKIKKFLQKKRVRLLLLIVLIGIGLFIYFFVFLPPAEDFEEEEIPEEVKLDKIPPSTAVISPENKSWHNTDFEVTINDSDIGAGLVDFLAGEKGCQYLIEDLGTNQVSGGLRRCDPVKILVLVGEEKTCSSSYSKENLSLGKCKVSTLAIDKAGNQSGWKSRVFNIDLIKPEVEEIFLDQNLELNQNYLFETTVSDNSKVTGCWFYVDGELIDIPTDIKPIPCENENQCKVFLNYTFEKEGDFSIRFGCIDRAGNLGFGKVLLAKVTTNHPPQISSCKVNPTQGSTETEFRFEVLVADPDGDQIFYLWDFGDGKNSTEENPTHRYERTDIFEPKVSVFDEKGEESECSTAWVIVVEE